MGSRYGRLQQGRIDEAEAILSWARDHIGASPLPREPAYYGAMYARHIIDTGAWDDADIWLAPDRLIVPSPHYAFARGYAAAKQGKLEEARALIPQITQSDVGANPEIVLSDEEIAILKTQLESVIEMYEGNNDRALELARRAAEMQAAMPFRYGPPRISKPTVELLGDLLLDLGRYREAAEAYADELTRSQLRTNSLIGLARASLKSGDVATARETYEVLANIWSSATRSLPAHIEVVEFVRQ